MLNGHKQERRETLTVIGKRPVARETDSQQIPGKPCTYPRIFIIPRNFFSYPRISLPVPRNQREATTIAQ
jgi:hypothetical protein